MAFLPILGAGTKGQRQTATPRTGIWGSPTEQLGSVLMDDLKPPNGEPPQLFSEGQVVGGTVLCGPLAGGWMLRQNFYGLGDPDRGRRAIYASALFTMAMAAVSCLVPTDVPNATFSLLTAIVFLSSYRSRFAPRYLAAIDGGATRHSFWRAAGVSLAALPVNVLLFGGVALLVPFKPINSLSLGANTVYFEQAAKQEDAEALVGALLELEVLSEQSDWDVTVIIPRREPATRIVQFVVAQPPEPGTDAHAAFELMHRVLKDGLYPGADTLKLQFTNALGMRLGEIAVSELEDSPP
jgi:hypothetical protein